MVVVEGATVRPFVAENTTMIVIGLILSVFGVGFLCWLLFMLAVYALPFFAGMTAGLAAYHSGSGVLGALVVRSLRERSHSSRARPPLPPCRSPVSARSDRPPLRRAGRYRRLPCNTRLWLKSACPRRAGAKCSLIVGAIFVGGTAFVRVAAMATPPAAGHIGAVAPAQPRIDGH